MIGLSETKGAIKAIYSVEEVSLWMLKYGEFVFPSHIAMAISLPYMVEAGIAHILNAKNTGSESMQFSFSFNMQIIYYMGSTEIHLHDTVAIEYHDDDHLCYKLLVLHEDQNQSQHKHADDD